MTQVKKPNGYEITINGLIDDSWIDWLNGFTLTHADTCSTLRGPLDQAALISLLNRMYSLGIVLISVNPIE